MEIKYDDKGLVPVIAQDVYTGAVLMLAYANEEAVRKTAETKKAHYFSRSRNKLWQKGETSGNVQEVRDILIDCDGDALIYKVVQSGPSCHTGNATCFFESLLCRDKDGAEDSPGSVAVLKEVFNVIIDRKNNPKEDSYTNYLFDKGIDKILKKVGEEAAETIIAAKNNDPAEIALEVSDLVYHLMVMLADRGMTPEAVYRELENRR
jgi:phosphoribosyl-AMP cyclohydrolase / phosphoribosyl-ATP pyrophosphohydrolase